MMKLFSGAVLALACLFSTECIAGGIDSDYHGADAGVLVFSTSTLKIAMNFEFFYERVGQGLDPRNSYDAGLIECDCVGFWHPVMADPDYEGYETGKVQVQHLPPGDYEVYSYFFGGTMGYSPRHAFSIPFTIRPGQATYIGNFARSPSLGTPMESRLGALGYFVISDQHERDITIARKKVPDLPPVTISVTDVSVLGQSELFAQDPVPH
jgi:hypothetical protein